MHAGLISRQALLTNSLQSSQSRSQTCRMPSATIPAIHRTIRHKPPVHDSFICSASGRNNPPVYSNEPASNSNSELFRHQDMDAMKRELSELKTIMEVQQQMINAQQETIQKISTVQALESGAGSPLLDKLRQADDAALRNLSTAAIADRRKIGLYDARYHSTAPGATPLDFRALPRHIVLVRHAESEGNIDSSAYTYLPDPKVPLTPNGWNQALAAGEKIKSTLEAASNGDPYRLFFYMSPYMRSRQTYEGVRQAFTNEQIAGAQEEVQLREQDFGNFQDSEGMKREKAERLRFGRFFYRFPNGESGADVYDRMTMFEDHLVRDINAGRFANNSSLVLVTHGLALRIFLMRWFHWTVDQFMQVYNPPNADPIVLERVTNDVESRSGGPATWIHTKALYRLSDDSMNVLEGCTREMCSTSWLPRGLSPHMPEVHQLLERDLEEDG